MLNQSRFVILHRVMKAVADVIHTKIPVFSVIVGCPHIDSLKLMDLIISFSFHVQSKLVSLCLFVLLMLTPRIRCS